MFKYVDQSFILIRILQDDSRRTLYITPRWYWRLKFDNATITCLNYRRCENILCFFSDYDSAVLGTVHSYKQQRKKIHHYRMFWVGIFVFFFLS